MNPTPELDPAELVRSLAASLRFARWTGADVVDRAWARPVVEPAGPPAAQDAPQAPAPTPRTPPAPVARPTGPVAATVTQPVDAVTALARLTSRIDGCTRCPHATSRNRIVYGQGNPNARLLIVGDAPGELEDAAGQPFQGPPGELLDKMLAAIGLARADVWLTTIALCSPGPGQPLHPESTVKCSPFLRTQMEAIKPDAVLLMGEVAAQFLLKQGAPLGQLRGRWARVLDRPTLATWPPAALLADPAKKREAWADLQLVRGVLAGP